jgi:hypothetical protein
MSLTRDSAIRAIASALVFSEPPAMANLTKARAAASVVLDALGDIGAVPAELLTAPAAELVTSNGHAPAAVIDQDELPI